MQRFCIKILNAFEKELLASTRPQLKDTNPREIPEKLLILLRFLGVDDAEISRAKVLRDAFIRHNEHDVEAAIYSVNISDKEQQIVKLRQDLVTFNQLIDDLRRQIVGLTGQKDAALTAAEAVERQLDIAKSDRDRAIATSGNLDERLQAVISQHADASSNLTRVSGELSRVRVELEAQNIHGLTQKAKNVRINQQKVVDLIRSINNLVNLTQSSTAATGDYRNMIAEHLSSALTMLLTNVGGMERKELIKRLRTGVDQRLMPLEVRRVLDRADDVAASPSDATDTNPTVMGLRARRRFVPAPRSTGALLPSLPDPNSTRSAALPSSAPESKKPPPPTGS